MPATMMKLDESLGDRMAELARVRGLSAESLVDQALRTFVEREEHREAFRQDAERAWAEYRSTGLHLTGDEVRSWLETWGTDAETGRPACHD